MEQTPQGSGLVITVNGPVMTMRYDQPEYKNGGDWRCALRSAQVYEEIAANPGIRALIITGTGPYFNTGGRVDSNDPADRERYAKAIARSLEAKKRLKIPVIAAVNGDCLKGGLGLVCEADLAVAHVNARFGLPEIRMGGVPMVVMAQIMGHFPKKLLLEACYSSEYFSAQTAYRIGLVNALADDKTFWPTVERYARMAAELPPPLAERLHEICQNWG